MLPQKTLSEDEFIAAIRSRSAFGAAYLYDQYSPVLFKIIFLTIRDQSLAETILEQVITHIWYSTDEFLNQSNPAGVWMAGIARRFAKEAIRPQIIV